MNQPFKIDTIERNFKAIKIPTFPLVNRLINEMHNKEFTLVYNLLRENLQSTKHLVLNLLYSNVLKEEGFSRLMEQLRSIKQGEIASWKFFDKRKKKKERIYISNPMVYTNLNLFKVAIGKSLLTLRKLPEGYYFNSGYISYFPKLKDCSCKEEDFSEEAQFEIVESSRNLESYGVVYENGYNSITVCVNEGLENGEISQSLREEEVHLYDHIETMKVRGQNAIYRVFSNGMKHLVCESGQIRQQDLGGCQEIFWAYNKTTMVKIIADPGSKINKDEFILMANNLKIIKNADVKSLRMNN